MTLAGAGNVGSCNHDFIQAAHERYAGERKDTCSIVGGYFRVYPVDRYPYILGYNLWQGGYRSLNRNRIRIGDTPVLGSGNRYQGPAVDSPLFLSRKSVLFTVVRGDFACP